MKLRVFETFAGIGAQHKALKNIKQKNKDFDYEITYISEWDVYSLLAYDKIHNNSKFNKLPKDILEQLSLKTYSLDGKTPYPKLLSKDKGFIEQLALADLKSNNLGSILDIDGADIQKEFDLLTYSFPCQDLSLANHSQEGGGMKKGFGTRSGLLWEIQRILDDLNLKKNYNMPKYLLLENVENMLSSKHLKDYQEWVNYLNTKLGYQTFTIKLSSRDFKNPQTRKRIFGLSIKKEFQHTIQKILERIENSKGKTLDEQLQNFLISKYGQDRSSWTKQQWSDEIKSNFLTLNNKKDSNQYIEELGVVINDTKSRRKIVNKNRILNLESNDKISTLTTKQDRHPNSGVVEFPNNILGKLPYRFITPRESLLIMGFDNDDYERLKTSPYLNNQRIYKLAGNSIVVSVLEAIFKFLYDIEKG